MPRHGTRTPAPPPELVRLLEARAPAVAELALAARALVLEEAPEARELVYDSYNAVAVAFTYTGRLGGAFCHVAAYRGHVNLGFNRGAELADPQGLLRGSGRLIRHVRLEGADDLTPALRALVRAAAARVRSAVRGPRSRRDRAG